MKREMIVLTFVTLYLVAYTILGQLGIRVDIMFLMFSLSPVLLIWLVISILKADAPEVKELKEGEEWGYQDTDKEKLGIF